MKMFIRLFAFASAIVLFSCVIEFVRAEEEDAANNELEERNPIAIAIVTRILAQVFVGAASKCLKEAANHCQGHHSNVKEALNCGRSFLHENRGRCVVGG